MSSNTQPRFRPEPVETTNRSTRRFAPQPVETTTRSSRKSLADDSQTPPKKQYLPRSVETTSRNSQDTTKEKRFLPQPVETSTRSSREGDKQTTQGETRPKSRFAPQLVETSVKSSEATHEADSAAKADRVVEEADTVVTASVDTAAPQPRRKFAPELLGSGTRSRRGLDGRISELAGNTLEKASSSPHSKSSPPLIAIEHSPVQIPSPELTNRDRRRLGIPLPPRQMSTDSLLLDRPHCFRIPNLDPIESSESEEEVDDITREQTPSSLSDISERSSARIPRLKESGSKAASPYLLEVAARNAERQIREQGLAAFPNDDRHTYVDHFIGNVSIQTSIAPSRSASVANFFRRDTGLYNTDLQYKDMHKHQHKLEVQREKEKLQKERRQRRLNGQPSLNSPWKNPYAKSISGRASHQSQKDAELERMRNRARPPMLGNDIVFPRCISPEPARFDVTQGSYFLRSNMCYLTEQSHDNAQEKGSGLWSAKRTPPSIQSSIWSAPGNNSPKSARNTSGLWGGFCHETTALPSVMPTGLLTPRPEEEKSSPPKHGAGGLLRYNRSVPASLHQLPPSPPPSNSDLANLDEKLEMEQAIKEEFDDAFISQVYNYLSLGYPSLARNFDEELAKIARVSIVDLRQDDFIATSRGYIRLGDDEIAKEQGIQEENCARWKALRLYVHEWARQQPFMVQGSSQQQGQTAIRRGSWAW